MLVNTSRFGDIDIEEKDVVNFISPILGFAEERKYIIVNQFEQNSFQYMQSVTEPNLTFVLADPFQFNKEYDFVLEEHWIRELEINSEEDVTVKAITTVRSATDITINLAAPIIINEKNNKAAQIIMDSASYSTRFSIITSKDEGGE
ncbi:flagellar assembly protein FliW [Paenibacillus sp. CAA11]|uniref:flagellar assembly protein FliW n=1 Tax=Paenibacillus sp. CAA11 TaxID=1532905 RepID=UPI000D39D683|nr:flagellar assembly protein FliW [Paenibacillus sp. CAA11]AWB46234.1 flagellar assembly protein FliW [Paenibacillus sp. CAA11]